MKAAFFTFGCKLNQCETEALASHYRNQGFFIESIDNKADLYIINTCTVTSKSEQKARRIIRNTAKNNPQAIVIVTGCYAQLEAKAISTLASNILVIPQSDKASLFELAAAIKLNPGLCSAKSFLTKQQKPDKDLFRYKVDQYQFHTRAFCKIQDGCNNCCSYCRVPLARGKSQSLEPEIVLKQVVELEKAGYREIVLTGINICAYQYGDITLVKLLQNILDSLSCTRIRLSSLEPEMITEELGDVLKHKLICPHFHIPVQSGSDEILHLMHRHYTKARVIQAVEMLSRVKPGAFISGDVIVGFPGETDADFQQTKELIVDRNFAGLHVFPFSPRPGTAAYAYKDQIPETVKKARTVILKKAIAEKFTEYTCSFKGKKLEIILEKKIAINNSIKWLGLSGNYLKVEIPDNDNQFTRGMLVEVIITEPAAVSQADYLPA